MTGPYAIAAKLYREEGWIDVLPLPERRKAEPPTGYTGAEGKHPSMADVLSWIEDRGNGNIALRLPDDVIGIDVDAYDDKQGAKTLAEQETTWGTLPLTWRTTSRGDGVSGIRFYRVRGGAGHYVDLPGVEVIHSGWRYAVVWPSEHPDTGAVYRWYDPQGAESDMPAPEQLPELPDAWLTGLAAPRMSSTYTNPQMPDLLESGIPPGANQDSVLRDVAWKLHLAEVPRDIAYELWGRIVAKTTLTKPEWKWTEKDFTRHWDRLDRKQEFVTEYDPAEAVLACVKNGTWLEAQRFAPLRYIVPDLIPEGSSLLVGPPKIGKSWLVLATALARAGAELELFGSLKLEHGPVLYLALEDGDRRMQDRCRKLLKTDKLPSGFDYATEVAIGQVVLVIEAWLKAHLGVMAYVILDTLGVVMPPAERGETAYQRDYRIGRELKRLADERHAALLTNHHDRKAQAEDFVSAVSGTHGLAGSADTTIVIHRKRISQDGLLKVTGRDVTEGEYAVAFDGITWTLNGKNLSEASGRAAEMRTTAGVSDQMGQIIRWVSRNATVDRPATATLVSFATGIDPATVRRYLRRAVENGRLQQDARGEYLPTISIVE